VTTLLKEVKAHFFAGGGQGAGATGGEEVEAPMLYKESKAPPLLV
jgi:hypothetical protein